MLRLLELEQDYASAREEWEASGEQAAWAVTSADGFTDAEGEIRLVDLEPVLPARATGLRMDSKAQAEQVRSVDVDRLGSVLGQVPATIMAQLDNALRLHLEL